MIVFKVLESKKTESDINIHPMIERSLNCKLILGEDMYEM